MILSNLKHSNRIESLDPRFKQVFDYVKSHDMLNTPTGRIELDGDNLFINNVETHGVKAESQPLEMHRAYIDIHILLSGSETIGCKTIDDLQNISQPYNSENDCALSDDAPVSISTMVPGDFMIVYPEDTHAPLIGDGPIRKLVGKIKL